MKVVHGLAAVASAAALACSGDAQAQAWIGQVVGQMAADGREHQCMMGALESEKETAEARAPAAAAMRRYWTAAHAGDRADVLAAFHPGSKARWRHRGVELKGSGLSAVTDPVARVAAALAPEPAGFVRAGDSGTARGVWLALGADGRPVGSYLAGFRRVAGVWKLASIDVGPPDAAAAPLAPYCHKPGDVAAYRTEMAEGEARRAAKKARKEAERAARAQARTS